MSDIAPPEHPGWYADAHGAWWWWDGSSWTAAPGTAPTAGPTSSPRQQERTNALLMWILYIVIGGWIGALVFYVISKDKPFVRHHAAEALNLTLVLLVPQVVGIALLIPDYIDLIASAGESGSSMELSGLFFLGIAVLALCSLANLGLAIAGAVKASKGGWWRLPIGVHPVRGVLRKGETPPYDVTGV